MRLPFGLILPLPFMPQPHRAVTPLPTGTVTFLFTDIEGSTRLWEAHRAAMQLALARHDALLRQCIEGHGGHLVKSVGDGACAAFVSATDALEASVSAQQALDAEPWPDPVRIRVRMALHSGPAELRDGDYFGPTLNRVARLLALARGGQTLVSAITYELCRDYLPGNVLLRSLGEHTLKDLDRPEAVFEVAHGDLAHTVSTQKKPPAPIDAGTPSIAVLPFVNMSHDEENEYFADGLAEEMLNVLSKIRGLRVASRTSAFSFKHTKTDIPTIAQKLNVATILEGSVRKSGKRVRISAQLIEVATDSHLWSATYDRELDDIFAVQDDIAQSVVTELRKALLPPQSSERAGAELAAEVANATQGRGQNAESYRLYLQGRFYLGRGLREDNTRGIEFYRQALALQPGFALAWAGLSQAYVQAVSNGWAAVEEGYTRAREAANRALALAPDLAEGHIAIGAVRASGDLDWKGADASIRRAIELAPGNAGGLRRAGWLAIALGRVDEAIALLRRAAALDPLNVRGHSVLAGSCLAAGLLDEAESTIAKAIDLDPNCVAVSATLGYLRLMQCRHEEALAAFEGERLDWMRETGVALAQHALGRSAEADAALEGIIEQRSETAAIQIAEIYAFRNETDHAFAWLERAFVQRDHGVWMLRSLPTFHNLRGDPRWLPFLAKIGLAD